MTGTIFLSTEDSLRIRETVLQPTPEYLRSREGYFERLASNMKIRSYGTDTVVEFYDLDLSALETKI